MERIHRESKRSVEVLSSRVERIETLAEKVSRIEATISATESKVDENTQLQNQSFQHLSEKQSAIGEQLQVLQGGKDELHTLLENTRAALSRVTFDVEENTSRVNTYIRGVEQRLCNAVDQNKEDLQDRLHEIDAKVLNKLDTAQKEAAARDLDMSSQIKAHYGRMTQEVETFRKKLDDDIEELSCNLKETAERNIEEVHKSVKRDIDELAAAHDQQASQVLTMEEGFLSQLQAIEGNVQNLSQNQQQLNDTFGASQLVNEEKIYDLYRSETLIREDMESKVKGIRQEIDEKLSSVIESQMQSFRDEISSSQIWTHPPIPPVQPKGLFIQPPLQQQQQQQQQQQYSEYGVQIGFPASPSPISSRRPSAAAIPQSPLQSPFHFHHQPQAPFSPTKAMQNQYSFQQDSSLPQPKASRSASFDSPPSRGTGFEYIGQKGQVRRSVSGTTPERSEVGDPVSPVRRSNSTTGRGQGAAVRFASNDSDGSAPSAAPTDPAAGPLRRPEEMHAGLAAVDARTRIAVARSRSIDSVLQKTGSFGGNGDMDNDHRYADGGSAGDDAGYSKGFQGNSGGEIKPVGDPRRGDRLIRRSASSASSGQLSQSKTPGTLNKSRPSTSVKMADFIAAYKRDQKEIAER